MGPGYSMVRAEDGSFLLRFTSACDIEISQDFTEVLVRPAVGASEGLATVLTAGAMLAFQLYVRGSLVLHASAVDLGGVAVAFVGRSGMGKSTMAALMCADGARLITDDVLRVDSPGAEPRARLGATDVRLRKGASEVLGEFGAAATPRLSADGRHVLRLGDGAADHLPLGAIVIPRPCPGLERLALEPLGSRAALLALLGFPRIPGWREPTTLEQQFAATAALLRTVPVYLANVPWGPPFDPEIAPQLRAALGPVLQAHA